MDKNVNHPDTTEINKILEEEVKEAREIHMAAITEAKRIYNLTFEPARQRWLAEYNRLWDELNK